MSTKKRKKLEKIKEVKIGEEKCKMRKPIIMLGDV
jgi:hypothetical protein